jgi:hypothetical protein
MRLEEALFSLHPSAREIYDLINKQKAIEQGLPFSKGNVMFEKRSPVADKILFSLRQLSVFSKVSAIEKLIKSYDEDFNKGLSTPLTNLKESNKIRLLSPSGSRKDVYYGLKEWFNEDGTPNHEYLGEDLAYLY